MLLSIAPRVKGSGLLLAAHIIRLAKSNDQVIITPESQYGPVPASYVDIDPAKPVDPFTFRRDHRVEPAFPPKARQISFDVVEPPAIECRVSFPRSETRNGDDYSVVTREMMRIIKQVIVNLAVLRCRVLRCPTLLLRCNRNGASHKKKKQKHQLHGWVLAVFSEFVFAESHLIHAGL